MACYACLTPFPSIPSKGTKIKLKVKGAPVPEGVSKPNAGVVPKAQGVAAATQAETGGVPDGKGVSESGRYKCQVCENHFCIDCDVYAHEIIHNCPGCQSDARGQTGVAAAEVGNGTEMMVDGNGGGVGDAMVL